MGKATSNADIDKDVMDRLIDHIRNNTTDMVDHDLYIPAAHFLDPARAEAELGLLRRLPLIVAHGSEVAEPGSFITREILGVSVIIVRRSDGRVAAYRNMCRHRGGRVEEEASGKKRLFSCQYHGWSYDRETGALTNTPQARLFESVEGKCIGLETFAAEERHGLVFLRLDGADEVNVAGYLGAGIDAQVAQWGLEKSIVFIDRSFPLDVNWKLVIDGALDSLHPPYLHRESVARLVNSRSSVFQQMGRHGRLYQTRRKFKALIDAGDEKGATSKYVASIMSIYPNALMMGAPDHVEFWTVWPSVGNPSRCSINIRFLVQPEILTPKMEERINKSCEILVQAQLTEDWPMELSIQRNIEANPEAVFTYGRGEVSAQNLHRQLRRDLDEQN